MPLVREQLEVSFRMSWTIERVVPNVLYSSVVTSDVVMCRVCQVLPAGGALAGAAGRGAGRRRGRGGRARAAVLAPPLAPRSRRGGGSSGCIVGYFYIT